MNSISRIWRDRAPLKVATWLSGTGIVVGLAILVFGVNTVIASRSDTWRRAEQATTNLALALEQDITHSLSNFNLALIAAQDAFRLPGASVLSPSLRQAVVFSRATAQADFGSMFMLDRDGRVTLDSNSTVPMGLDVSDRDYFTVQRDNNYTGLYISRPFHSRVGEGEPSIALSRRMQTADGEFDGIVGGVVRLSFFKHLFEKLDLGPHGSVKIMRTDGAVISRFPPGNVAIDAEMPGSLVLKASAFAPSGQFLAPPTSDRQERLVSYRVIEGLPLILNVALATEDIFSGWWYQAIMIGVLIITLCTANILLSLLFRHEMKLRLRAEALLTDSADKLAVLALTDGLTQIGNRRAFDAELGKVWRAAIRAEQPVALLMIDADHFKTYNDTQGHQAGDEVLSHIAACIKQRLRRPTDFAARYGGEEFVALLPNTEAEGALEIAETIRTTIARAQIAHPASPHACVTVSVGVAIALPQHGQSEALLIQDADAALYRAKQTGRNRIDFQKAPFALNQSRPLDIGQGAWLGPLIEGDAAPNAVRPLQIGER